MSSSWRDNQLQLIERVTVLSLPLAGLNIVFIKSPLAALLRCAYLTPKVEINPNIKEPDYGLGAGSWPSAGRP